MAELAHILVELGGRAWDLGHGQGMDAESVDELALAPSGGDGEVAFAMTVISAD